MHVPIANLQLTDHNLWGKGEMYKEEKDEEEAEEEGGQEGGG